MVVVMVVMVPVDHADGHPRRGRCRSAALQVHVVVVVVRGRRRRRHGRAPERRQVMVVRTQDVRHGMRAGPVGRRGRGRGQLPRGARRRRPVGHALVAGVRRGVDGRVVQGMGGRRYRRRGRGRRQPADLVPQDPAYRRDGRHVVLVAHAVREQPVADLPREDARVLVLEALDVVHDPGRGDAGLGAADGAGKDGAGLVVAGEDLGHAAVADAELPRYIAGPDAELGELYDPHAHGVRKRSAVHEHPSQLVHFAVLLGHHVCKDKKQEALLTQSYVKQSYQKAVVNLTFSESAEFTVATPPNQATIYTPPHPTKIYLTEPKQLNVVNPHSVIKDLTMVVEHKRSKMPTLKVCSFTDPRGLPKPKPVAANLIYQRCPMSTAKKEWVRIHAKLNGNYF